MSATTAVNIDFITQYKGAQNLKRAKTDMEMLGGAAKKLGGLLGVSLGGAALASFGIASVKAFAANQKQIAILSNTLKNFGVQGVTDEVDKFITSLTLATGATKEELIPAYQSLFIATGDVMGSQKELQLAMDVSAGTGKDLQTVTTALSKGYLGNTTALTRLGAGLSKSVLATKDMNLINKALAKTMSGDAAVAADSLAGKVDRLKQSFYEMEITIGKGLVDAFSTLTAGSSSGITSLQHGMETFGKEVANVSFLMAALIKYITTLPVIGSAISSFFKDLATDIGLVGKGIDLLTNSVKNAQLPKSNAISNLMGDKNKENAITKTSLALAKAQALATAKNLADAKALTKAAQDKLKAERDSLNLKLAGSTVDMQNIEIQAALQRGQTQQVNDVLLLQRAIITGNADQAEVLSQAILKANGLVMDVKGNISSIGSAKDPFADWPTLAQSALDQIKLMLAELTKNAVQLKVQVTPVGGDGNGVGGTGANAKGAGGFTAAQILGYDPSAVTTTPSVDPSMMASPAPSTDYAAQLGQYFAGVAQQPPVQINVSAGPGIIVDATQSSSSNGTPVTLDRLTPLGYLGIK